MDTIRYLLGFVIKLAVGLFLLAFVIWLIGFLYPQFTLSNLVSGDAFRRDWLPAPKDFSSYFAPKNKDGTYGKTFVPNAPYNSQTNAYYKSQPGVDFIAYTESGTKIIRGSGSAGSPTVTSPAGATKVSIDRPLYIRNLSLYEGGNISYGTTFVGEARDTMFKNGVFPILIVDSRGNLLASAQGINTGTWATPGWARFQATIPTRLPNGIQCSLVFLSSAQTVRVGMTVKCN